MDALFFFRFSDDCRLGPYPANRHLEGAAGDVLGGGLLVMMAVLPCEERLMCWLLAFFLIQA